MLKQSFYIVAPLAGISLALAVGCKQEAESMPAQQVPQVEVITIATQRVPDEPEFIGQAEASRPVEIRPQVTGILKAVLYREGRDVKQGDRLYQIDPIPFQGAAASAKAKIAQAEARLVQAKQDLARVKPLLAEQAVSQKDVDDAVAGELAAEAALQGAKADLIKTQFDLDNTLITAPIDGLIERSRYYEGRLVSAQTDLLTVIHRVDPMYVVVSVPETFILRRRRDVEAHRIQHPGVYKLRGALTLMDGTVYPNEGVLDLLEPGLRTETGARQFRITFPNPKRILLPGQFVKVRFKGDVKTEAVLVPQRAVLQGPTGPFVFVINDEEKVEMRDVVASDWKGSQWLIDAGLKAGDRVVVNGLMKIGPGAPVQAVPWVSASASRTEPVSPAAQ
ncbi:MAG: efflux RND transporter periplasmic adaptor subunit [Nitrospiraceae bacterium]|jgi:membrane fusion protein (multidrug efflux system)|uniref:efflux RND transporter periplasmic adaptor subunit n=1 Tax=Nitrospira cf. moscoviensis SBR1015 TaxID=96242 RepID=UPI000A0CB437|nr:efflux RND transporter periplasmic adaptor subunit [Nitrospira cf. moscoviensis SBR1015]MBY0246290.1 efflux RND transporter periplasmic adaptor subunit [Nitrospiraceae bacterium]OQW38184.1 MAG: efflux transporter periplasmic adaptor subunit [Nitrospira sp. SG-bin2]